MRVPEVFDSDSTLTPNPLSPSARASEKARGLRKTLALLRERVGDPELVEGEPGRGRFQNPFSLHDVCAWREKGQGMRVLIVLSVLLATACAPTPETRTPGPGKDRVIPRRPNDPELEETVKEARAQLPKFIAELKKPGERQFFVKSPFPTDDDSLEHMWTYVVSYDNGVFSGELANEPVGIKSLHNGDKVTVKEADVDDWMIKSPDGKTAGRFSGKVFGK